MFGGARPESTSGARAFCILSSISSAQARVRKFNDQHGKKTSCIKQILPVALDPFAGVWILDSVKAPSRKSRIVLRATGSSNPNILPFMLFSFFSQRTIGARFPIEPN
ncbi:hypothetical protein CGGC5_v000879 [Colletotrichum fructicola Nara gc5]|uniref:Uncharacterized protein n=1 Tax=Colletotrichum fructicola (strain Nara gc5) TaxID=1213859 RepID=A0A7J6JPG4_COLFN|nr:hypothetical protein CFRS1_v004554 [Colletotrichum fructicola]KAF4492348.1 hypothetical protein CGGC5_v000879 [Colletotrichum fructicola Nara gc5]